MLLPKSITPAPVAFSQCKRLAEAGIMIKNAHYRDEYTEKPMNSREGAGSQRCNF